MLATLVIPRIVNNLERPKVITERRKVTMELLVLEDMVQEVELMEPMELLELTVLLEPMELLELTVPPELLELTVLLALPLGTTPPALTLTEPLVVEATHMVHLDMDLTLMVLVVEPIPTVQDNLDTLLAITVKKLLPLLLV